MVISNFIVEKAPPGQGADQRSTFLFESMANDLPNSSSLPAGPVESFFAFGRYDRTQNVKGYPVVQESGQTDLCSTYQSRPKSTSSIRSHIIPIDQLSLSAHPSSFRREPSLRIPHGGVVKEEESARAMQTESHAAAHPHSFASARERERPCPEQL